MIYPTQEQIDKAHQTQLEGWYHSLKPTNDLEISIVEAVRQKMVSIFKNL